MSTIIPEYVSRLDIVEVAASRDVTGPDMGKLLRSTSGSAVVLTLGLDQPRGKAFAAMQAGAGQLSIVPAAGSTIYHRDAVSGATSVNVGQWVVVTCVSEGGGDWWLVGGTGTDE